MKTYAEITAELSAMKDETYRVFNERIVNIPAGSSIGVRTPMLRAYGKQLIKKRASGSMRSSPSRTIRSKCASSNASPLAWSRCRSRKKFRT